MNLALPFSLAVYTTFWLYMFLQIIKARQWVAAPAAAGSLILIAVASTYWFKPACRAVQNDEWIKSFLIVGNPLMIISVITPVFGLTQTIRKPGIGLVLMIFMAITSIAPALLAYRVLVREECQMNRPPNNALHRTDSPRFARLAAGERGR